jgi:lipopolysaccharide/colanic/teichoic acid biosynthesis glycosyltransferase
MSLVGPRPPLDYEVDVYEPWQLERLSVRPGITGWWQVSGRNRMSYVQMCERDIEYARGWSVGWDVSIIARTPWVMVSNSGRAT